MAGKKRTASRARSRPATGHGRRILGRVVVGLLAVAVLALPAWRAWWRVGESTPLRRGLESLESEGCVGCHRAADGAWRWRADGGPPESLASVEDALRSGRPANVGLGPAMPGGVVRAGTAAERRLVLAVGATAGLVGVPEEPELAVGYQIATELGCFSCHGPLGSGRVRAPGTVAGEVPGWHGRALAGDGGDATRIRRAVVEGARQSTLPWARSRGGRLAMPAYGDLLDSTEVESLVGYVEWVHHEGIGSSP